MTFYKGLSPSMALWSYTSCLTKQKIQVSFLLVMKLELRRLAGSLFYYLIGESKELAKYIYEKICKKLYDNGLTVQPVYKEVPEQNL